MLHNNLLPVGTAADTCVCFARGQQGEQTVAGLCVVFQYPSGSEQTSHFTDVTRLL